MSRTERVRRHVDGVTSVILDILRSKHATVTISDGFFITLACCNPFIVLQESFVKCSWFAETNDAVVVYGFTMY